MSPVEQPRLLTWWLKAPRERKQKLPMILKPEPRKDPECLLTDSDDKATTGQPRFKEEEGQALPLNGGVAYVHKGKELIDGGHLYFRYNI